MKVYVVSEDMGFTVRVFTDKGKAFAHPLTLLTTEDYNSFTVEKSIVLNHVWNITFPHKVESCTGHWRIEEMDLE